MKIKRKILLFTLLLSITLIPQLVNAKNVDKYAKDGKIVFKSIKPKNKDDLMVFFENLFYKDDEGPGFYVDIDSCNSDFTKCIFLEGENDSIQTELEIVYEYDENIKKVVEDLVKKIPNDKDTFNLTEMELISYLYNKNDSGSIANYSSDLKKYIEYKNFGIDIRLGDGNAFYTMRGGNALFTYNDTIYYNSNKTIQVESKHYFYIPNNSTNIIEAMKDRLTKNFKGWNFEIEEMTYEEFITSRRNELISYYSDNDPNHEWIKEQYPSAEAYADETLGWEYLNDDCNYPYVRENNYIYKVVINGKEKLADDFPLYFIVKKDSEKIVDNELITVDSESNITITTMENIPLDTLIQVSKITSGEEYEKIVKLLSVTNSEMFDLKLFSKSIDNNIIKLDNGTFEVKIPISDKLKDKDLIVYYVGENNNIQEYPVTIQDNYAVFNTNHFSIYTLAEKEVQQEPKFKLTYNFNGGTRQGEKEYIDESVGFGMDITKENFIDRFNVKAPDGYELEAIEINGKRTELGEVYILNKDTTFKYIWKQTDTEKALPDEPVPKTLDNIYIYMIILITSIITLSGTIIINRKKLIKSKVKSD